MKNKEKIGFIGQGYVGKNYADNFERRGLQVIRYALEEPYLANRERIRECTVVFIAVPTPTTPAGFNADIVREALSLTTPDSIAVIKSTIVPGTTVTLQNEYPDRVVLFSPEFLSEATAVEDTAHPFASIIGMPIEDRNHRAAAEHALELLPLAPFSLICTSAEAEIIKYSHNASGYVQVVFFNIMYELAQKLDADWSIIAPALRADPLICNHYTNPVHKSGRGAGGNCFIKDFAALRQVYEALADNEEGFAALQALEKKNRKLLSASGKDLAILRGVYGKA